MRLLHRLHPHRLPNAANGCVPDAVRVRELFAERLAALLGRVPDADDKFALAILQRVGDIETERVGHAAMRAEFLAIDEHCRFPIDRFEVQQNSLAFPCAGVDVTAIPEFVLLRRVLADTAESAFDAERDEDLAVP